MRRFSIADKLIIASLFLSVVTILTVGSYSFYKAKEAVLERSFNQLNSVRVIKTNLLEAFFRSCIEEVELIRSSGDLQEIVHLMNQGIVDLTSGEQVKTDLGSPFIQAVSKGYFHRILLIGNNGSVLPLRNGISVTNPGLAEDCKHIYAKTIQASKDVLIQDYGVLKSDSSACLTLSSRIEDEDGNILGVLILGIASTTIDTIMLNYQAFNGLGASGESYLVGDDFLMRSSSRFQRHSILKTRVKTEAVEQALAGQTGAKLIKDYRNISVLSSYSRISVPQLNWIMLAEIDYDEVTVPIYRIRSEIIFISIFLFLIVLIVVLILSRKIIYPIQKLNRAAHEVGAGNLDVKVSGNSDDEIGELTDTFNRMVIKLKEQSLELEQARLNSIKALINGQEIERQRLSRELHDSLGQLLIGLKLKYESCYSVSKKEDNLGLLFDQTIEETRRISNNLMPATLSQFGLKTAVRNICNEIAELSEIDVQLDAKGSDRNLDPEMRIYLFRIIQEALTNIVKHSQALKAEVKILFDEQKVLLDIRDDGKGFEYSNIQNSNSNGLNNIRSRVSFMSGTLNIDSGLSRGTTITVQIPLK